MEKETIWRLQDEDFRMVMGENYPDATEEQIEKVIQEARMYFTIPDWTEYVEIFVDNNMETKP